MRLVSTLFEHSDAKYRRFAAALTHSARVHSPATPFELIEIAERDNELKTANPRASAWRRANARKTKHHARIIQSAADGELIGLLDVDTMITGDLSPISDMRFDLAITVTPPEGQYRINSGVVFVRVSEFTRRWYAQWYATVQRMLINEALWRQWKDNYGGINQCALAYLLANSEIKLDVAELPCAIWNSVGSTWAQFSPETKIVHLLGNLRNACLAPGYRGELQLLARKWQQLELDAREAARRDVA